MTGNATMTDNEWADYVAWSGLDEDRLAEILRDRDGDRDRDRDGDRDRESDRDPDAGLRAGRGAGRGAATWLRRLSSRCRTSTAPRTRHRGTGEQRDS